MRADSMCTFQLAPVAARLSAAPTLSAALMAVAVASASVVAHSPPLWRAIAARTVNDTPSPIAGLAEKYERDSAVHAARFVGRSMFFQPLPPHVARAETMQSSPREAIVDRLLPAPPEYTGPEITGFLDNTVFLSGRSLSVGETLDGVTLLDATSPDAIHIRFAATGHEPGEYLQQVWKIHTQGFEPSARNRR